MKNIKPKLVKLFKEGYCTPQIARIAKKLREPSTTIHYNIKKLEEEGAIKTYKAVFDYKKIDEGLCVYVLINVSPDEYGRPEKIAEELAKHKEIESVDILAGEWELILKIRSKNQDEYYKLLKNILARKGIKKSTTLISLKQVKTNFLL
ncbi:MAG: Lrp/AsnC family transcriptional regulator [Candidatus Bathyarchaeia archaeon]